jgi:predicted methyltransferase
MKRTTLLLCLLASFALAQDASVKPGINDKFLDPKLNVEEWTKKFETESREIFHQREKIVAAAGLKPGMAMADIGAGTGLFTLHFAQAVGADGKVYRRRDREKFPRTHQSPRQQSQRLERADDPLHRKAAWSCRRLASTSPSSAMCITTSSIRRPALATLHKALKPGGELVLIDFKRIPGQTSDFIMGHVRAGQEVFEAEVIAAGFEKVDEVKDLLKENYFVKFKRK